MTVQVKVYDTTEQTIPASVRLTAPYLFDGTNDYTTRDADLTGIADSKTGIVSCWIKTADAAGRIFGVSTGRFFVELTSGGDFRVVGKTAANAIILDVRTSTSIADDKWHHVAVAWNLATATTQIYRDGVEDEDTGATVETDDTIDYTGADWAVGATTGGAQFFAGELTQIYFQDGETIDLDNAANLAKFISTVATPVDFASDGSTPTGTQSILFLNSANVLTNSGSGGNFGTENGDVGTGRVTPVDFVPGYELTFDTELYDRWGMHSTSSNQERLTVVVPGLYLVTSQVAMPDNDHALMLNQWTSGGVLVDRFAAQHMSDTNPGDLSVSGVVEADVGDYFTASVWHNTVTDAITAKASATATAMNSFSAVRLGP